MASLDAREKKVALIRHDLGLEPAKEHKDRIRAHFIDLESQMLDTPALAVAGVLAKLQSWYCDHEIEVMRHGGEPDTDMNTDLSASIYRDLERLSGEARL